MSNCSNYSYLALSRNNLQRQPPETATACRKGLPRITMWFYSNQFNTRHDFLRSSNTGEMQRIEYANLHGLYRPHQSVRSCQQNRLFKILQLIGCPPKLHHFVKNFHNNMQGVVEFNGSASEPSDITSGVKHGCVLALSLFGIFFAIMLQQAFKDTTEGAYIHTRTDRKPVQPSQTKGKAINNKIRITVSSLCR